MTVPEQFKEYIWLLNVVYRAGKISFEDIQKQWAESPFFNGTHLAKSSFHRHKEVIANMFGVEIICDRRDDYKYRVSNASLLREDTVQNWLLSTLTVGNIVGDSLNLQNRILLEQVPCDDYLQTFIEAMKNKVRVKVEYQKYGSETLSHVDFEPYCIKLFKQRWYVLAHFYRAATEDKPESNYFALYSMDRIKSVALTQTRFEVDPRFVAKDYFADSYGVIVGGGQLAERIVLRVYGVQRFYLKDLPLHRSQTIVREGEDYTDFMYKVRPTVDFKGHIMSLGSAIKVLEPQSLADDIRNELLKAAGQYE